MTAVKLTMVRQGSALLPCGPFSEHELSEVPQGEPVTVTVRQARNPQHHDKLFSVYRAVADTDAELSDAEQVHEWVKVRLRMFDEYEIGGGRVVIRTKSIRFESMDQVRFQRFYGRALSVLAERLGCDPEELLREASEAA